MRHRITAALHRIADVNARHVDVAISGATVTLSGHVTTWAQRDAAEKRASAVEPAHAPVELQARPRWQLVDLWRCRDRRCTRDRSRQFETRCCAMRSCWLKAACTV